MRHLRMTLDDGKTLTISEDGGYCKIGIELPGQNSMSALLGSTESEAAALAVKNVSKEIT